MITLPHSRIRLETLLAKAEISKNTVFRLYRYNPAVALLLDIQEDRDHHLHFAADAGQAPKRPCPGCGANLHPRHTACVACDFDLAPSGAEPAPKAQHRDDQLQAPRGAEDAARRVAE